MGLDRFFVRGGIAPALWAAGLMALGALAGCDSLPFGYTDIGDITANAARLEGHEVKIRGKVTDSNKLPLVDIKSYSVKDDTGEVTVITGDSLPAVGQKIAIRAIAQNMLVSGRAELWTDAQGNREAADLLLKAPLTRRGSRSYCGGSTFNDPGGV